MRPWPLSGSAHCMVLYCNATSRLISKQTKHFVSTGAHTLGKAHLPASGYDNKWVHFPDWCDNEYYKDMINPAFKWTQVKRFSPVAPGKVL